MNKELPSPCKGLPEEIEELFKQGLTNRLMLDKVLQFKPSGKKLDKRFTVCLSASINVTKKECAFITDDGTCHLKNLNLKMYGCHKNIEAPEHLSQAQLAKLWCADRAAALLKYFVELTKPS